MAKKSATGTKRGAGANAPFTWGAMYLMFLAMGRKDFASHCLDRIIALDG